jgi:hypothetical protein
VVRTRTVTLPAEIAEVAVALAHHAEACGTVPEMAAALDLLLRITSVTVPDGKQSVSPSLVSRAALKPLLERVENLESPLEEDCLGVLADAGVALDFRNGRSLLVRYFDRLTGPLDGKTTPDFFHPWTRVAIYCDSAAHHSSREDRARDNLVNIALMLRGYAPVRLTTELIRSRPKVVVSVVTACLKKVARETVRRADAA